MDEPFDPYRRWLGITPQEQPPQLYRLLGIPVFEGDPDVIGIAADRQMAHLPTFQAGKHSAVSQKLLNEMAGARVWLLNPSRKAAYDAQLSAKLAASAPGSPSPPAAPQAPDLSLLDTDSDRPAGSPLRSVRESNKNRLVGLLFAGVAVAAGILFFALLCRLAGVDMFAWLRPLGTPPEDAVLEFDWPEEFRADVSLTINGRPIDCPASAACRYSCPAGDYRILATRWGFDPIEQEVHLSAAQHRRIAPNWRPKARIVLGVPDAQRRRLKLQVGDVDRTVASLRLKSDSQRLELAIEPGRERKIVLSLGSRTLKRYVNLSEGDKLQIDLFENNERRQ
jgi:hypothetical protein